VPVNPSWWALSGSSWAIALQDWKLGIKIVPYTWKPASNQEIMMNSKPIYRISPLTGRMN
jgi:hypothetical protein